MKNRVPAALARYGKVVIATFVAWFSMNTFAANAQHSTASFERLKLLVGNWEGTTKEGHKQGISYRLSAGGSVLVETWALGPNRESVTLYSIDGNDLIATHYCPQGNQPRLQLVDGNDLHRLDFKFRDGTNLHVKGKSHQYSFWMAVDGPDSFSRAETYVENDSSASEIAKTEAGDAVSYTRIAPKN